MALDLEQKQDEIVITTENEPVEETKDSTTPARGEWANSREFIMSCAAYAIGYGNIWRFPYLCYKNGGAVFLIPYLTMIIAAGIPLLFMELFLGQYVGLSPTVLFPEMAPVFTGLGWAMFVTVIMAATYYNHVMAWSFFYVFSSFTSVLPWSNCDNYFNSEDCFTYKGLNDCRNKSMYYYNKTCVTIEEYCNISSMKSFNETFCYEIENITNLILGEDALPKVSAGEDFYRNRLLHVDGKTWDNMGGMNWEIVGCLLLSWILVCVCMIKGIKTSGKSVYFFAVFPYAVLLILLIRGLTLEGASEGIHFYIMNTNISKLSDSDVWYDAANQIFFSVGIGFGAFITLASYNKVKHNCMRDAIGLSILNCVTAFLGGFVTFSILGFIAHENNVPVEKVVNSGSGLAFIAYPTAVALMPCPQIWSLLFFLMLIAIGVGSQLAFIETIATALCDCFLSLREKRPHLMIGITTVCFLLGLPMCIEGGIYIFELMNFYAVGLNIFLIALLEVIIVAYFYGYTRIVQNIREDMSIPLPQFFWDYFSITWLCFTPISVIVIFVIGCYSFQPVGFGSYIFPVGIQSLGWLMTAATILPIIIGALYAVIVKKTKGYELINPTPQFGPAYLKNKKDDSTDFKYILDNYAFESDVKHTENQKTDLEKSPEKDDHEKSTEKTDHEKSPEKGDHEKPAEKVDNESSSSSSDGGSSISTAEYP